MPSDILESLHSQSCDAQGVVLQLQENLRPNSSLEKPESDTKGLIRCLAREAKSSNKLDVVKHLRDIVPAGTTGRCEKGVLIFTPFHRKYSQSEYRKLKLSYTRRYYTQPSDRTDSSTTLYRGIPWNTCTTCYLCVIIIHTPLKNRVYNQKIQVTCGIFHIILFSSGRRVTDRSEISFLKVSCNHQSFAFFTLPTKCNECFFPIHFQMARKVTVNKFI